MARGEARADCGQAGMCGAAGLGLQGQQPQGECPAGPGTERLGCGSGRWRAGSDVRPNEGKDMLWEPAAARKRWWVDDGPWERRDQEVSTLWPWAREAPSFILQDWIASGASLGPVMFILFWLRHRARTVILCVSHHTSEITTCYSFALLYVEGQRGILPKPGDQRASEGHLPSCLCYTPQLLLPSGSTGSRERGPVGCSIALLDKIIVVAMASQV